MNGWSARVTTWVTFVIMSTRKPEGACCPKFKATSERGSATRSRPDERMRAKGCVFLSI